MTETNYVTKAEFDSLKASVDALKAAVEALTTSVKAAAITSGATTSGATTTTPTPAPATTPAAAAPAAAPKGHFRRNWAWYTGGVVVVGGISYMMLRSGKVSARRESIQRLPGNSTLRAAAVA